MSTRARVNRGPQALKSAAENILYEYEIFRTASKLCLRSRQPLQSRGRGTLVS